MADKPETRSEGINLRPLGAVVSAPDLTDAKAWFVREVLPLEAMLTQYLRRHWRNKHEIDDLCQEVYARVYEAACKQIPHPAKPFVFTAARNLLIDHVRREHVISIEAVADLDTLNIALDEPGPERSAMAREELRRLQGALDRLPRRCREAVVMKQVDGLSRREIAGRMGVGEETVKRHLTNGMYALADFLYGERKDSGS
jgi:RNA polymerase sigma factor (sigma-70 family)